MKMKSLAVVFATIVLMAATVIFGEEKLGVQVYPGAKPDSATAEAVKKMMSASEVGCFRTSDTVSKVLEFYKKQANLKEMGTTAEGGMFQKKGDDKVSLTVQNPWMDMATGKMMKDTLISIVKQ
jgi:hypothetical protein